MFVSVPGEDPQVVQGYADEEVESAEFHGLACGEWFEFFEFPDVRFDSSAPAVTFRSFVRVDIHISDEWVDLFPVLRLSFREQKSNFFLLFTV